MCRNGALFCLVFFVAVAIPRTRASMLGSRITSPSACPSPAFRACANVTSSSHGQVTARLESDGPKVLLTWIRCQTIRAAAIGFSTATRDVSRTSDGRPARTGQQTCFQDKIRAEERGVVRMTEDGRQPLPPELGTLARRVDPRRQGHGRTNKPAPNKAF